MKFSYSRDQKKSLGIKISPRNINFSYFTRHYIFVTEKVSISLIYEVLFLLQINLMKFSKIRCEHLMHSKSKLNNKIDGNFKMYYIKE